MIANGYYRFRIETPRLYSANNELLGWSRTKVRRISHSSCPASHRSPLLITSTSLLAVQTYLAPPPPPNLSALPHHTRIATSHAQSHTNPHCSPSQARNIKSQTPKSPSSEANTIPTMIFFSQENAKALTQPKIHAQEPRHRHSALRRPIHAIPQGRRR